jgi:hypothetical protein
MHRETEFAGVAEERQREWIRAGVGRLHAEGLAPRVFVAPRHGFDRGTLRALAAEGVPAISDGFAERAFRRGGVTWIPQQIWEPVEKSRGLWTICVHSNTASDGFARALGRFVAEHRTQMSSLDEVLAEGDPGPLGPAEGARAWMRLTKVRLSKARKRWMGRK